MSDLKRKREILEILTRRSQRRWLLFLVPTELVSIGLNLIHTNDNLTDFLYFSTLGELPDVQISFKDLLLPLEVLARADHNISRLLYSSLVVGIIKSNSRDVSFVVNNTDALDIY
jgi:hypothetical protein